MPQNQIKILCYGDSNTWGQKPVGWEKYDSEKIWANMLERLLGEKYIVINEGLCGRFAGNLEKSEPVYNGLENFLPNLIFNLPIDILIISLGTNDFKTKLNQSGEQIFENLMKYLDLVESYKKNISTKTKIVFVTPPNIDEKTGYFANSKIKNKELTNLLKANAKINNYSLVDISDMDINSEDGVHFDPGNHRELARLIFKNIIDLT